MTILLTPAKWLVKAIKSRENSNFSVLDHFADFNKMIELGTNQKAKKY